MSGAERKHGARRRVVVTGLGVVSPIGIGAEEFWRRALAGSVGTSEITQFDTSPYQTHRGGEVVAFRPELYINKLDAAGLSRSTQFAVAVTRMALEDAGLLDSDIPSERVGVCFGIVLGNRPSAERYASRLCRERVAGGVARAAVTSHDAAVTSRAPAAEFGLTGPNLVLPTACAAGNSAISFAMDAIRAGRADVMVAGGADELSKTMFMLFNSFRSMAPLAVQPFDRHRKGLMLSEGAAALVLESDEHARARGARIYGEVAGHGNSADAYHMTAPHPEGRGAVRSIREALGQAGLGPDEVNYISAHGTGTPVNDLVEAKAIHTVFGKRVGTIPVSSIKGMLGHTQGAASAIEAVSCLLAIRDGIVPPNANYEEPDEDCDLDVVANAPRRLRVDVALNNAFGFGGNISCVVFTKV
ncbi:MAG TPA: beta-ketoacyl-[acyl-carrier-protein] synthase family protein [Pyrinomonadaceae bacterium]|nr:beta-ketoacyl-[acyl-carrier-protein] synthase family protein [Pyrinomonadaceae bacterium]